MLRIAMLAGLAALAQVPRGADDPSAPLPEDASEIKRPLKVVTDGKQHYLAFPSTDSWRGPAYWSADGKTFYRLRSSGGSAEGQKSFDINLWEPRVSVRGHPAGFSFRDGKYAVACGEKTVEVEPVAEAEAKALTDAAQFFKFRWRRMPYRLARDEKGTYYFVDHLREDERSVRARRDYRLYVGPRGALKLQNMTNLVADSEGEIFGTKSGEFRLVLNNRGAAPEQVSKWVSGGKETKLTSVPSEDNVPLIYNELGVYERSKLGTPCDEF